MYIETWNLDVVTADGLSFDMRPKKIGVAALFNELERKNARKVENLRKFQVLNFDLL